MSNFPDFSQHGYQIISQLGENHLGGRVTYLAERQNSQNQTDKVVIKQFQFALMGATWAEYDAYSQEITMLRQLNHPGIAQYIDAFQTPYGFCMVQEYLNAESLATPRSWTPKQIKLLAESVLEILVYLQSQNTPIIHRDIKPENILVDEKDEQMNVYLVDFGFARMGGGEIAASSVVKGTMGFMPPEQLFNRQLTNASDLYGLGGTLICLLTGTKSVDIGNLIDADYRINFRHLVPPVKRGLINWLEKLTDPRLTHRYSSAASALAALQPIDVDRLPKVRFNHQNLEITATEFGQILTETITITNPIPETTLSGRFSVDPHPSDPPHTPYEHSWISFNPQQFSGNEVVCKITIDTSKLVANETYQREIVLHSNSASDYDSITVKLHTYYLPNNQKNLYFYFGLLLLFFSTFFGGYFLGKHPILLMVLPLLMPLLVALDQTELYKIEYRENISDPDYFYLRFIYAIFCHLFGIIIAEILLVFYRIYLIYLEIDISHLNVTTQIIIGVWVMIALVSPWIGILFLPWRQRGSGKSLNNFFEVIQMSIGVLVGILGIVGIVGYIAAIIGLINFGVFGKFLALYLISRNFMGLSLKGDRTKISINLKSMLFDPVVNLLNPQSTDQSVIWLTCTLGLCLGASYLTYVTTIEYFAELFIEKIFWIAGLGLIPVLITSIPLISYLIQRMQQVKNVAKYLRSESTLIKP